MLNRAWRAGAIEFGLAGALDAVALRTARPPAEPLY
jgi:hypothetical protein